MPACHAGDRGFESRQLRQRRVPKGPDFRWRSVHLSRWVFRRASRRLKKTMPPINRANNTAQYSQWARLS